MQTIKPSRADYIDFLNAKHGYNYGHYLYYLHKREFNRRFEIWRNDYVNLRYVS